VTLAATLRARVLLAALLAGTTAAPLVAHPTLRRSVPGAGDTLRTSPRELRLTFSEAVEHSLSFIKLFGSDNRVVPLSPVSASQGDRSTLTVAVADPLPPGSYTVAWQAAGSDGHPVRGRFTFVVTASTAADPAGLGVPAGERGADTTARGTAARAGGHHPEAAFPADARFGVEGPLYIAVRWLTFAALLAAIGVVGFEYLVARPVRRRGQPGSELVVDAARRRAAWLGAAAAGLLLAAGAARLATQAAAMQEPGAAFDGALLPAMLLRTTWGWGWLLQLAAASAAFAAFRRVRRAPERGWLAALFATLALAVTPSLAGHAVAADWYAPLPVLADSLHVLGAGGWLGTLLVVVLAGLPATAGLEARARGPMVAELVNAFSPAALVFAGLAAGTGLFAAWLHLGTLPALWQSRYGRTLLLKLAVLAGVAVTGFYNWRRVRPALGDEIGVARLRRSSTIELLIALAVLLVTAVLVATPPPGDGAPERRSQGHGAIEGFASGG
jgi:putative copper export protein/methionine-rich copper-binding protein CopC